MKRIVLILILNCTIKAQPAAQVFITGSNADKLSHDFINLFISQAEAESLLTFTGIGPRLLIHITAHPIDENKSILFFCWTGADSVLKQTYALILQEYNLQQAAAGLITATRAIAKELK